MRTNYCRRLVTMQGGIALALALTTVCHGAAVEGQAITPIIPPIARPLPLSAVRLTGGPLKQAQDLDAQYLLALEPDRMLAGYRLRAGLEPKAKGYGGWDSVEGKQLTGHIGGHYLSGVSLMWAATGDPRFKERADYMVKELQEVQEKNGDGYLGALANGKERFAEVAQGNIRSGGFDLNGLWSPWYVLHKTYAGLRDAYRYTGNRAALDVEITFAAWAEGILSKLNDAQIQRMLNTEFGGMNEVLADLYADTGEKRWLELSYKFEHRAFTDPLKRHQDNLAGQHGNTQVPKMLGSLARFGYVGDPGDGFAASFFWDRVVQHHSYATGGHGKDEYFGEPDKLNDRVDGRTCETCNVYNLLKLTRSLFALRPDAAYADFHERALFNHILASQDPQAGWACYMVPVGRGVQHEYERDMLDGGFTCCTGSSMESHALHGDGLYYQSADKLWVNLYAPSTAEWAAAGVKLTMTTDFPEGESARIQLALAAPKEFTILVRRPFWVETNFSVRINGEPIGADTFTPPRRELPGRRGSPAPSAPVSSFVPLKRSWKNGDQVTITLPKTLRLEPLPDNPRRVAVLWGPLVLAGDLGPEQGGRRQSTSDAVPVFVAAERPVADWLKPVLDKPGCFRTEGVGKDQEVDFVPFYRLHRRTYGVYWDLFTPGEWEERSAELAAEREKQGRLEAATVGYVQPGEMQAERDANMRGEETEPVRLQGRAGRRGAKWFSFDLPVDPTSAMTLIVTYNHDEWQERTFEILVDGARVGAQTIERRGPMRFFDVEYAVPAEIVQGKQKVPVKFQATRGNEIGAVFGIRTIAGYDPTKAPRFAWRETALTAQPRVLIQTALGDIEVELDGARAPVTTQNFLRYTRAGLYNDGLVHRTVTLHNQPTNTIKIQVIQASANPAKTNEFFPPIALERTRDTGLKHVDGVISMARDGPDSGRDSFFICVGDQPALDFGGQRNPDGQGFAAFGRVVKGMEVVRKIHAAPADGQSLTPPMRLQRVIRTE